MKRVLLSGTAVLNVAALSASSPAGTGQFLDVADALPVSPGSTWNGSTAAPSFTPPPVAPMDSPILFQCKQAVTNANGHVIVVWDRPFMDVPIPISFQILDPAGGVYVATLLANSANGLTYQVRQQRTLPAVISLVGTLGGYDTFQPAPAGLAAYVSAKLL